MKKLIPIVTIVAILSLMLATFVFADESEKVPQWFKDMITWKKAQVDQAEKDGAISKEQADLYKERIDQMEKFHEEYGFSNGMGFGGPGGCGGGFYSGRINGGNTSYGYGPGMMGRGYGYGMMNGYGYPVQ